VAGQWLKPLSVMSARCAVQVKASKRYEQVCACSISRRPARRARCAVEGGVNARGPAAHFRCYVARCRRCSRLLVLPSLPASARQQEARRQENGARRRKEVREVLQTRQRAEGRRAQRWCWPRPNAALPSLFHDAHAPLRPSPGWCRVRPTARRPGVEGCLAQRQVRQMVNPALPRRNRPMPAAAPQNGTAQRVRQLLPSREVHRKVNGSGSMAGCATAQRCRAAGMSERRPVRVRQCHAMRC